MQSLSASAIRTSGNSASRISMGTASSAFCAKLGLEHLGSREPILFTSPRVALISSVRAATNASRARNTTRSCRTSRLRCCIGCNDCGSTRPNRANLLASSDHPFVFAVSTLPLIAGRPPALRARNRRRLPAPRESVSPHRKSLAPHSMPERIRQCPPASYATVPPPAFHPPDPECSSGSIGPPDPHPPSDDRDWGEAHLADALLRRSVLPPFSDPAFPSVFPPVPPALPSYPAASGPAASPVSLSLHSSFENCYASSRSISLSTVIAP